jgi:hypothetical protein
MNVYYNKKIQTKFKKLEEIEISLIKCEKKVIQVEKKHIQVEKQYKIK